MELAAESLLDDPSTAVSLRYVQAETSDALAANVFAIPCRVASASAAGVSIPVDFGVPLPEGLVPETCVLKADASAGNCQARVLARWPDGSVKWVFASLLLRRDYSGASFDLLVHPQAATKSTDPADLAALDGATSITLDGTKYLVATEQDTLLQLAQRSERVSSILKNVRLLATLHSGESVAGRVDTCNLEESGSVRQTICLKGRLGRRGAARFTCRITSYRNTSLCRMAVTIENPRRAKHPNGYWDLGDPGSLLFRNLSLEFNLAVGGKPHIYWQEQPGGDIKTTCGHRLDIYQDSSGGENWQSRNHVNRHGQVPLAFRGYRVRAEDSYSEGLRASPTVSVVSGGASFTCTMEEFWQKFPTALEVKHDCVLAHFWPEQSQDLHELQAGEHCTRVVWFNFSNQASHGCEHVNWVHERPQFMVEPQWIAKSKCVPYLPSPDIEARAELQTLLSEAIEGPNSFFAKREIVDEFGWRHYGDVWADHEEQYSDDPKPVLSHYNNQYDLLHGMLVEFLRSGDRRWWQLAAPLAQHVLDIDIYHTTRDKPAYNGGLFWHTAHYHSVGSATHRSMSRTMQGKRIPAPGTGPCNEHNYSAGLLLYHYLSGCPKAREAVIGLGDWVIHMDDGARHMLGAFSNAPTGEASRTSEDSYHGPGRGAGNSINALLNAWRLTDDAKYLDKLSELIHRTIHPLDNIAARDLSNAELRWSYTVYLHALINVLEATAHVKKLEGLRRYIEAALLHYGRWMANHERLYLEHPEQLEYPTETWAAQDLRKGTALLLIAQFAATDEGERFRRRGMEILDQAWQQLFSFPTRSCSRALALVLQQGYSEMSLRANPKLLSIGQDRVRPDFGVPEAFIPQKQDVKSLLRSPWKLVASLGCISHQERWLNAFRQTWLAERMRHLWD